MGCIIMNPQNGEIYAMSSYPEYNLNNPRDLSAFYSPEKIDKMSDKKKTENLNKIWRNYCISDAYEPGSTFKPMTVAACLDEGVTTGSRAYHCDGYQVINGVRIKCVAYSRGGHGTINICQSLMESCNDVLMQLGADLGKRKFLQYVNEFGFGKKTGIDLPGEATGGVFTNDTMHAVELATSSFGQGQTVTMIQMAAAFSSVINGGNYYEPHVVKEVKNENGAVLESNDNALVRRVITENTSKKLRKYLYKTVEEGTALPAKVAGYQIGGKTGTAEKHPTGRGNYLVSFIGFATKDNPEVMIYVTIDEPHVADQAHSTYATQFSSEVLKEVLPVLGMYQDSSTKKADNKKSAGSGHTRPNNMPSSNSGGNGKPPALPTNQKPLALPDKQNSDSSQSTVHSSSVSQSQETKSASKRGIVDKKAVSKQPQSEKQDKQRPIVDKTQKKQETRDKERQDNRSATKAGTAKGTAPLHERPVTTPVSAKAAPQSAGSKEEQNIKERPTTVKREQSQSARAKEPVTKQQEVRTQVAKESSSPAATPKHSGTVTDMPRQTVKHQKQTKTVQKKTTNPSTMKKTTSRKGGKK